MKYDIFFGKSLRVISLILVLLVPLSISTFGNALPDVCLTPDVFDRTYHDYTGIIESEEFDECTENAVYNDKSKFIITSNSGAMTVKADADGNKYLQASNTAAMWDLKLMKCFTATENTIMVSFDYRSCGGRIALYSDGSTGNCITSTITAKGCIYGRHTLPRQK